MKFLETPIRGVYVLEVEKREDDRGFFARTWCARELAEHGLDPTISQANTALSRVRGTVRGMHFQRPPHEEVKLVSCTHGAVFDVALDLRPTSPTYRQWYGVELSADNYRMLYIPKDCGHGYQTLEDSVNLMYFASTAFAPDHATGVRYDDPAFAIKWPLPVTMISEPDRTWPLLTTTDARV